MLRYFYFSDDVCEDTNELQRNMFEDVTKQLRNKTLQETMVAIRARYGKNAILKGVNFDEVATVAVRTTIRPPMSIKKRAKQFAMFDALKGLKEAIGEKETQSYPKKELSEDKIDELNQKLKNLRKGDRITVEYYCEHGKTYQLISGEVERIDTYWKCIQIRNISISFSEIINIHCQ